MCALKGGPLWPFLGECGGSIAGHCSSFSCCLSSVQNQDRHPLTDLPYLCLGRVPCATLKEGKTGSHSWVTQGSITGNGWWPRACHQFCLVVNPGLPHTQLLRFSRQLGPSGSEFRGPYVDKVSLTEAKAWVCHTPLRVCEPRLLPFLKFYIITMWP